MIGIVKICRLHPQSKSAFSVQKGILFKKLKNNSKLADAISYIESKLSDTGRILIRNSGTEALVRVMVECNDLELATESANYLADVIKSK